MVPVQVTSVALYIQLSKIGWVDTFLGILAPNFASAFGVFMLRQGIKQIPVDVREYSGKVSFVKVNVDESGELASKYNIFSIPTLAIFNKGEIITQQVGAASKDSYKNMIENALKKI